jgi:hypothetical protein
MPYNADGRGYGDGRGYAEQGPTGYQTRGYPVQQAPRGYMVEQAPLKYADPMRMAQSRGMEVDYTNQAGMAERETDNKYLDPYSAFAFLGNLLISLIFGTVAAVTADWNNLRIKDEESLTPSPTFDPDQLQTTALEAAGVSVVGLLLSIALAYASLFAAEKCTRCLLYTGAVLMIITFFILFVLSRSLILIIIGVVIIGFYGYLLCQKAAIEFAIWVVQTSCKVLKQYGGVIRLSFIWLVLQALVVIGYIFFALAGQAAFGTISFVYLMFSLYWAAEVLSNVLVVTVSSVAAFWATGISNIDATRPVSSSFYFSITFAFGSICLGSLIVAILKTARLIARLASSSAGNDSEFGRVVAMCCMCFLSCIEGLIEYFNEWAFAYIAMYRKDFRTSASYVWNLLKTNGYEAVANDIYTDMVTFLPPVVTGLVVAGLYALYGQYIVRWSSSGVILGAVAGGILGFVLCQMVMRLIGTVQNVIFLSYIEQRGAFYTRHPDLVKSLEQKFRDRFPDIPQDRL